MKFLSIISLIEFTRVIEDLGYKSSISISNLKRELKEKLKGYVSQYVVEIVSFNNYLRLNFNRSGEQVYSLEYVKA